MALLNFPSSPTNGQVYTSANGVSYQYNGTFWSSINTSYATGGFTKLDNISSAFNGSNTTFNLTASGVPVTPGTAQNLIITIGGVTQEPANAYTVSTSTITFTSAPPSGVTFSGVMLGAVMNVGVPSDSTVTSAKLDTNIAVSANLSYGGTLTGSTGILNIGSGQIYKDTSGNVGIGVTPPAGSTNPGLFIAGNQGLFGTSGVQVGFGTNIYNASGTWKYITSAAATLYQPSSGTHAWYTAPSGTAGNAISFTQAMTLDANGKLGINSTSPNKTFHVNGDIQVCNAVWYAGFNTNTMYGVSFANAGAFGFEAYQGTYLYWGTGIGASATEKMRLDSSGNLLVGTTSGTGKLVVNGAIAQVAGAGSYSLDVSANGQAYSNGATVSFSAFSGMIITNNWDSGDVSVYICGGGTVIKISSTGTAVGTVTYSSGINGYIWTNNSGATKSMSFAAIRTRPGA